VGYLVKHGLIPKHTILDGYSMIIARCWIILENFIQAERNKRQEDGYQKYFEYLAELVFGKNPTIEKANKHIQEFFEKIHLNRAMKGKAEKLIQCLADKFSRKYTTKEKANQTIK